MLIGELPHPSRVLAGRVLRDHDLDAGIPGLGDQPERLAQRLREERRGGEEDADRHGSDGSAWRVPSGARHRMLRAMWVFPLVAAAVAFVFTALLVRQYADRRRPYQLLWAISLAMYGVASAAAVVGVRNGWSASDYRIYWALGAVLNVPFLAAGELQLLVRNRAAHLVIDVALVLIV